MNSLKSSAVKHPFLNGLLIILIFEVAMLLITLFVQLMCPPFFTQNGDFLLQGTIEAFLSAVGLGVAALYGYSSIWSEKGIGMWRGFVVGMYFIVISALSFVTSIANGVLIRSEWEAPWKIIVFTACVFLIGLCEETFFRGVMANLFYDKYARDPAGVWTATVASGMLFGLMHLANMLGAPDTQYIVGVLVQTFSACAMGMALSAIYFRCRNIWTLVLIHGFVDFCGASSAGFFKGGSLTETIGSYTPDMFISAVPYLILTAVLLRPAKIKEILDYRRTRAGLPVHDGAVISTKESKRTRLWTVIISIVIGVVMFGYTNYLYQNPSIAVINETLTFSEADGRTAVTEEGFYATETKVYTVTVQSLPTDSNASATLMIYDGDELIKNKTYGGRCAEAFELELEADTYYTIVVRYDCSQVTAFDSCAHSMLVKFE